MGGQVVDAFKNRRFQGMPDFSGKSGKIPVNMVSITNPGIGLMWIDTYFGQRLLEIQEISIFSF